MKNIIRRIIVGIIIGLVLMCARKYLFVSASALEVKHTAPDGMAYCLTDGSCATNAMNTYAPDGLFTTFYGFSYGNYNRQNIYWAFPSIGNYSTPVDLHFTIFVGNVTTGLDPPFQVMIKNDDGSLFTCNVNASNSKTTSGDVSLYANVLCENVAMTNNRFRVIMGANFMTGVGGNNVVAISPVTSYEHSATGAIQQAVQNGTSSINNSVQEVNDTLSDSSTDDPDNAIEDMNDSVATNGTISQLLTLPIQLYQNILNSVSGSCSSFNLGNLLGTTLLLPCINLQNLLGSTLYGVIDILCSGLFILSFRKKMVDIFNHMTSLNDRGNELE